MPESAARTEFTNPGLESLAAEVVELAMKAGASDAEAVAREGDEFSVNVRMGQVETLKESGSRGLGLRVFLGLHSASASTSDLTPEGIRQLVDGALALATLVKSDDADALKLIEGVKVTLNDKSITVEGQAAVDLLWAQLQKEIAKKKAEHQHNSQLN